MSTALSPSSAGRGRGLASAARRLDPSLLLALVPVLILVVVGWELRWVNEDGFIYFRVVDNLLAGDGPVFNAGERIEAYTSPAWLALLAGLSLLLPFAGLAPVSVVLGVVLSAFGLAAACAGARRLDRALVPDGGARLLVPLGALVVVATPAFCQISICGPVLDVLLDVTADHPDVRFLHAEVYVDPLTDLDLKAPVVDELGLTFEPCLVLVGRDGTVADRLDTIYDTDELSEALARLA